jgi:uncharacterized delta-60 repeat protein
MLRNMRTSIAAAVTLFLLAMGLPNAATALGHERPQQAPGTLDTTFGTGGIVTNALAQSAIAQGVVQQSDGKLVVAGFAVTAEAASVFSEVARYNQDGSLDTSFGTGGTVAIQNFLALALAIQTDDRIVVAGANDLGDTTGDFGLARLNTDGSMDTTFGGGLVSTSFSGGGESIPFAVAIQPDGKIIAAGATGGSTVSTFIFAAARYNTDGTLDSTFGTVGTVTVVIPSSIVSSIAIEQDGEIILGGGSGFDGGKGTVSLVSLAGTQFVLAGLNPDGSVDTAFGNGGKVQQTVGSGGSAFQLALQADGKIVAAGAALGGSGLTSLALTRYNTDGSLDTSFGSAGTVTTKFDGKVDVATGVAIQQDGKIVVGGFTSSAAAEDQLSPASQLYPNNLSFVFLMAVTSPGSQIAVARYNPDGSLDTSFGTGGVVTTAIDEGAAAFSMLIQQDNNIVLSGAATLGGDDIDFALARYLAGPLAGEFSLSATESSQTVDAGSSTDFTIDVQAVTGSTPPTTPVALSASIAPSGAGVTASFSPASASAGASSTLEIATTASTTPGPYTVTIAGTSGPITATTSVVVTVASGPDFSIGFSALSVTAAPGTKVPISVLVNRTGGFAGKVKVTAPASFPTGIALKGSPSVSTKGATVAFKIKIAASATPGSDQLTFTGTDKTGRSRTGTLTLVVQ